MKNKEQLAVDSLRRPSNKHKVPVKQWNKWRAYSCCLFNQVYAALLHNQDSITGPDHIMSPLKVWKVTVWNTAWIAASEAQWLYDNPQPNRPK